MPISIPDTNSVLDRFSHLFTDINFDFWLAFKMVGYFIIGFVITLYICRIVGRVSEKHISAHHSQLLRRITFYVGLLLSIIFPLAALGINVTGFLGTAGILAGIITAAVAFASQTSISNFLSGVFLIVEKPFEVGDYVFVNDTLGEVLSIDLLSVKIRTKDNTFVRIPNERLLKSQFKNVSRFPIRRCDIKIRFNFKEDLSKIKKILMEVARNNPLCLVSPAPELTFLEFGEAALLLQFSVWSKQTSFSSLQTNIQMEIQAALNDHDIELPVVTSFAT